MVLEARSCQQERASGTAYGLTEFRLAQFSTLKSLRHLEANLTPNSSHTHHSPLGKRVPRIESPPKERGLGTAYDLKDNA